MIPTSVMTPRVQPPQKPTAKTSSKSESNGTSRAPSRTRSDPVPSPSMSVHPSPVETRRDLLPVCYIPFQRAITCLKTYC